VATNPNQLAKSGKFGDLRRRLVFLLLALVVYRIGAHIPVPGIDPAQLQQFFKVSDEKCIALLPFHNNYGGGKMVGMGMIYDKIDNVKKYEPRYRLVRLGLQKKRDSSRKGKKEKKNKLKKVRGKAKCKSTQKKKER